MTTAAADAASELRELDVGPVGELASQWDGGEDTKTHQACTLKALIIK